MSLQASSSTITSRAGRIPKFCKLFPPLFSFASSAKKDSRFRQETTLMKNARMLMEESIALFDGKINPLRFFSLQELKNATSNFDKKLVLGEYGLFCLYGCSLRQRMVILKKYWMPFYGQPKCYECSLRTLETLIRDMVVASRMSVHKNVPKLIGCCLETDQPILVFDYVTLQNPFVSFEAQIRTFPWKDRLKIAVDLSNLLAYLHTALPRPIIHRDFSPSKLFFDEDGVVKLFDFSTSIPIPEGQPTIRGNCLGTVGFVAPEYLLTSEFNEKVDVYSFGVILLVLLSGRMPACTLEGTMGFLVDHEKRCIKNKRFDEILDPTLSEGPWPGMDDHIESFAGLALWCTRERADDRPDIIDVARQLKEMHQSLTLNS